MNVIFGAGGFAREVGWLLHDLVEVSPVLYSLDAFVASDSAKNIGEFIQGSEVFAETTFFQRCADKPVNIFIAIGEPRLRMRVRERCSAALHRAEFPSLIHPSVLMDERSDSIQLGRGSIVCAGSILTTEIAIGDFVQLHVGCTIGHGAVIGSYSTLSPGVHISGNVAIDTLCFVGAGAVVLENLKITADTIIGAGATVVRPISIPGTYVGTPAKRREKV